MENNNRVRLINRLEKNYSAFVSDWLSLSSSQLIEKAKEISATQLIRKKLINSIKEEKAAWLLRFENPLEILRDKWIQENGMVMMHNEDFSHALWSVMDGQDTESLYVLAKDMETSPDRDKPLTVRDFIEKHRDVAFKMMTPGGYVYLTLKKAQLLLDGQSVSGHPGNPEYNVELPAEGLLNQEVVNANFCDGAWHLLSDYILEMKMEQEQAPMEGVTLC